MSLNVAIPRYAFGTTFEIGEGKGKLTAQQFKDLMIEAVKLGVRHFDCAPLYGTQKLVGEVIKEIVPKLVTRDELFITSKLPANMIRGDFLERSIKNTLSELGLDYLDAYLIHAPFFTRHVEDDLFYPLSPRGTVLLDYDINLLERTWSKVVAMKTKKYCKLAGICNINLSQLRRLHEVHRIDIVQNEYHLFLQDRELFDQCEEYDTHFEAYAAFGSPKRALAENLPTFLSHPKVDRIAKLRHVSKPEIVMRWLHSQPLSYVIKTDTLGQLKENLDAVDKENVLTEDLIRLDALEEEIRLYKFTEHRGIERHPEFPFRRF